MLKEEPLEKIRVSDLCHEAYINKSTFYRHYNDIYALYGDLLRDLFHDVADQIPDYTLFFTDPLKFYRAISKSEKRTFDFFQKQLAENPVDLYANIFPDVLMNKIYATGIITRNTENDLKLGIAIDMLRRLQLERKRGMQTVCEDLWVSLIHKTMFPEFAGHR